MCPLWLPLAAWDGTWDLACCTGCSGDSGVVPVTTVAPDEALYDVALLPPSQRDSVARLTSEAMRGSEGLPVGVQVMTPMWRDELCLHIMEEVEKGVNFRARPRL